jgi:hypothetical protein
MFGQLVAGFDRWSVGQPSAAMSGLDLVEVDEAGEGVDMWVIGVLSSEVCEDCCDEVALQSRCGDGNLQI